MGANLVFIILLVLISRTASSWSSRINSIFTARNVKSVEVSFPIFFKLGILYEIISKFVNHCSKATYLVRELSYIISYVTNKIFYILSYKEFRYFFEVTFLALNVAIFIIT